MNGSSVSSILFLLFVDAAGCRATVWVLACPAAEPAGHTVGSLEKVAVVLLVGKHQPHALDDRPHLRDVVAPRLFVRAMLEAPLDEPLSPPRAGLAEGVEPTRIPAVHGHLRLVLGARIGSQLGQPRGAVADVTQLLLADLGQHAVERLERPAE